MQIDKTTPLEEIADKLNAIKDFKGVFLLCLTKDGRTFVCSSNGNAKQHSIMAKELLRAGKDILADLAIACDCPECSTGTKVH